MNRSGAVRALHHPQRRRNNIATNIGSLLHCVAACCASWNRVAHRGSVLHCVAACCTALACCSVDGWALLDGAVLRTLLAVLHADAPRAATYEALWLASTMAVHATVSARVSAVAKR